MSKIKPQEVSDQLSLTIIIHSPFGLWSDQSAER
jgi:hypothetical protein